MGQGNGGRWRWDTRGCGCLLQLVLLGLLAGCPRPETRVPVSMRPRNIPIAGKIQIAYRLPVAPERGPAYASVLVLALEVESRLESLLVFDPSEMQIALAGGRTAHVLDRPRALALLRHLTPMPVVGAVAQNDPDGIRARVAAALLERTVFGPRPLRGYVIVWADEGREDESISHVEVPLHSLRGRAAYRLVLKRGKNSGLRRLPLRAIPFEWSMSQRSVAAPAPQWRRLGANGDGGGK